MAEAQAVMALEDCRFPLSRLKIILILPDSFLQEGGHLSLRSGILISTTGGQYL